MVDQSRDIRTERGSGTRPTNVSLSASLVQEAKELGVNISSAASNGLKQAVAEKRAERWLEANTAALDDYNQYVEENGLPLTKSRLF